MRKFFHLKYIAIPTIFYYSISIVDWLATDFIKHFVKYNDFTCWITTWYLKAQPNQGQQWPGVQGQLDCLKYADNPSNGTLLISTLLIILVIFEWSGKLVGFTSLKQLEVLTMKLGLEWRRWPVDGKCHICSRASAPSCSVKSQ